MMPVLYSGQRPAVCCWQPPGFDKTLLLRPASQREPVRDFLELVRTESTKFEADGRVLRLKQYLGINARPAVIDAVLDALADNTLVEALYMQNFEEVRNTGFVVFAAIHCW